MLLGVVACFVLSFAIGPGAGCAWGGLIVAFAVHKLSITLGFDLLGMLGIAMLGLLALVPFTFVSDIETTNASFLGIASFAASIGTVLLGALNSSNITDLEYCTIDYIIHIKEFFAAPVKKWCFSIHDVSPFPDCDCSNVDRRYH